MVDRHMRFLRRHRYALGFLAVLVICSVLVQCQFIENQSAHVRMREDFILLQQGGHTKLAEHLYQRLVQSLSRQSDRSLLDDYQRTAMLVEGDKPQLDNLVWKYHVSVKNEFSHRAEKRIERLLREMKE